MVDGPAGNTGGERHQPGVSFTKHLCSTSHGSTFAKGEHMWVGWLLVCQQDHTRTAELNSTKLGGKVRPGLDKDMDPGFFFFFSHSL